MSNEQLIENAKRGIQLLRLSRPGTGDMATRSANKKAAMELLGPYCKKQRWPKSLLEVTRKIDDQLIELF